MRLGRTISLSLAVFAVSGLVFAAQKTVTLRMNGTVASSDVRTINGRAYVPVADVAKALGMTVVKGGGGLELVTAGGANALGGFTGKQGDVVFTGKWRFSVLGWKRAREYQPTLSHYDTQAIEAKPGQELLIFTCRVKNGLKAKDELVFSAGWEGMNTAITAQDEQTFAPLRYDVNETENAPNGVVFLPGAAIDFKIVFQVPEGTQPKDLVFTAMRYSMRSRGDQKQEPPQNIRVRLNPES